MKQSEERLHQHMILYPEQEEGKLSGTHGNFCLK